MSDIKKTWIECAAKSYKGSYIKGQTTPQKLIFEHDMLSHRFKAKLRFEHGLINAPDITVMVNLTDLKRAVEFCGRPELSKELAEERIFNYTLKQLGTNATPPFLELLATSIAEHGDNETAYNEAAEQFAKYRIRDFMNSKV